MIDIESSGITDIGRRREQNEDSLFYDDGVGLYVVADGMGGHKAGEVASKLVVETIRDYIVQNKNDLMDLENNETLLKKELNKYHKTREFNNCHNMGDILETNLFEITSPFTDKLSSICAGITPKELEVAGLIKAGKTNSEIADLLGITESACAVQCCNVRL